MEIWWQNNNLEYLEHSKAKAESIHSCIVAGCTSLTATALAAAHLKKKKNSFRISSFVLLLLSTAVVRGAGAILNWTASSGCTNTASLWILGPNPPAPFLLLFLEKCENNEPYAFTAVPLTCATSLVSWFLILNQLSCCSTIRLLDNINVILSQLD